MQRRNTQDGSQDAGKLIQQLILGSRLVDFCWLFGFFWEKFWPFGLISTPNRCLNKSEGGSPNFGLMFLWNFCVRKGRPKDVFMKIPRIEIDNKINFFKKDRHQDPQTTVPGSGFEQTWKNNQILDGEGLFLEAGVMPKVFVFFCNEIYAFASFHKIHDAKRDAKNY